MVLRMTLRRSPERSPTIHHDLLWSPVATIAVLSAGASPFLSNILASVTAIARSHDVVRLIWSGRALPPCWIPNTVDVVVIPPPSFDHGGTRQLALELCHTEFLVLLSDDAEPANAGWLAALLDPFKDQQLAAVYGRQTARATAPIAEVVFRQARYPEESRRLEPSMPWSMVSFPTSNANAGYRAAALRAVGGFPSRCPFGEDRIVLERLLKNGWRALYSAEAVVWHSHDITWRDTFRRALQTGALSKQIAGASTRASRGGGALLWTMLRLAWRDHGLGGCVAVTWTSVARVLGFLAGRLLSRQGSPQAA